MLRIITTIGAIQAVAVLVNLLRSKVVAVLLGPEGVGIISLVDQLVQLVAYASCLSLPFTSVKFLSRAHSRGFAAFQQSYASFFRTLLAVTTAGSLLGLVIVLWRPELLGRELYAYRAFLIPSLLGVPAIGLHGFFSSVLAAGQRARASAFMTLTIAVAFTSSATAGIVLAGILGLYWGNLLAAIGVAVGTMIYLRERLGLHPFATGYDVRAELRENAGIIGYSFMLYSAAFSYSLSLLLARYALLAGSSAAQLGLLQAALTIFASLNLVLGPANGLYLTPLVNRNIAPADKMQAALEFQGKLMLVVGALAMPMVLFPYWLVTLLFSPSFVEVGQVIVLFVVAQCVLQLAGVYQALLIGFDDLKLYGAITVSGHLLIGVGAWFLAPGYGVLGVALGVLLGTSAILVLAFIRLSVAHGMVLPMRLAALMVYGLFAVLAVGAASNQQGQNGSLEAIGAKVAVYCLFAGSLWFFLGRDEQQRLRQLAVAFRTSESGERLDTRARWRRITATLFGKAP